MPPLVPGTTALRRLVVGRPRVDVTSELEPHPRPGSRSRRRRWLLLGVGVVVLAVALWQLDLRETVALLRDLDPRVLPLLVLPVALSHFCFYRGWMVLWPLDHERPSTSRLVGAYLAGEAANVFTPGQMGGEPLKVLGLDRRYRTAAFSSVVAARSLRALVQLLFMGGAMAIAIPRHVLPDRVATGMALVAGVLVLVVLAVVAVQGLGFTSRLVSLAQRLGAPVSQRGLDWADEADRALEGAYRRPFVLLRSASWSLLGWVCGALELWLVALAAGRPLSVGEAVIAEGLAMGFVNLFFFVPGQIGVIEGGRMLVLEALGHGASLGLVAGLVRRARHYLFASVAVAASGWLEGRSREHAEK